MTRVLRCSLVLIAALVAVSSLNRATLATTTHTTHTTHATKMTEKLQPDQKRMTLYRCAAGDCDSAKPGVCPTHKTALKQISVVRTWKCESCGMTFNHAGLCTMDNTPLTAYDVNYTCPADGKPVEHGGMCTRCDMEAKEALVKSPMALAVAAKARAKK